MFFFFINAEQDPGLNSNIRVLLAPSAQFVGVMSAKCHTVIVRLNSVEVLADAESFLDEHQHQFSGKELEKAEVGALK